MTVKLATGAGGALLKGRIAVITGASSGLGRAMALAFTKHGGKVVCADRSPAARQIQPTHDLIREQGGESIFVQTDVSDEKSIQHLTRTATETFGRIDIMVNNAGIASEASNPRPIWETTEEIFDATWKVNVRGVFLGCKYAGAQMLKQTRISEYGRTGTIINLGSILGVLGKSGTPAYAAAKGAVIALTREVAMDFAPNGIHCNSILPGFTRTPMISAMTNDSKVEEFLANGHPLKRLGEPEEIADAAVFLASSLSNGITGLNMSVDGGLHSQLSV